MPKPANSPADPLGPYPAAVSKRVRAALGRGRIAPPCTTCGTPHPGDDATGDDTSVLSWFGRWSHRRPDGEPCQGSHWWECVAAHSPAYLLPQVSLPGAAKKGRYAGLTDEQRIQLIAEQRAVENLRGKMRYQRERSAAAYKAARLEYDRKKYAAEKLKKDMARALT